MALSREAVDGKAVNGITAEHFYVAGSIDGTVGLYRFTSVGGEVSAKNVTFNGAASLPIEDPDVLTIGGVEHLLYAWGHGSFALYAKASEDDSSVNFVSSSLYDFTAITSYVQSLMYMGTNQAYVSCPEYNDTHATLYFTLARMV